MKQGPPPYFWLPLFSGLRFPLPVYPLFLQLLGAVQVLRLPCCVWLCWACGVAFVQLLCVRYVVGVFPFCLVWLWGFIGGGGWLYM